MASGPFNPEDLINAVYDSLIASGVDPGAAKDIAEGAVNQDSGLLAQRVVGYLNQAWNMVPDTVPFLQKELYVLAILTAMRGNPAGWDQLMKNDPVFAQIMKGKQPPVVANPDDVALAFAQHYMRERYVVGYQGDDAGAKQLIWFYDFAKRFAFDTGISWIFKRSDHNPSPPSPAEVWWSTAGIVAGKRDHNQNNPGQGGTPFGSLGLELNIIRAPKKPQNDVWGKIIKNVKDLFSNLPVGAVATSCPRAQAVPVQQINVQVIPGPTTAA